MKRKRLRRHNGLLFLPLSTGVQKNQRGQLTNVYERVGKGGTEGNARVEKNTTCLGNIFIRLSLIIVLAGV